MASRSARAYAPFTSRRRSGHNPTVDFSRCPLRTTRIGARPDVLIHLDAFAIPANEANLLLYRSSKGDETNGAVATGRVTDTHGAVLQIGLGRAARARALTGTHFSRHDLEGRPFQEAGGRDRRVRGNAVDQAT